LDKKKSGSARSGTTILGKIIHSFQNVEYAFEPPILFSLFALIDKMPKTQWGLLYETFLYEDILMGALSGRGLNCNRKDDSSIYKVKTADMIKKRLSHSLRKVEANSLVHKSTIAYKMPNIVPFIPKLKKYYPQTKVVVITRNAPEVFHSLLEKKWFGNKNLRAKNIIWPNRTHKGLGVPFWVRKGEEQLWYSMDELHRCAYYYIRVNKPLNRIPNAIVIKYNNLVAHPTGTAKRLAAKLNLRFGEKTRMILKTVKKTEKRRDQHILEKLDPVIRKRIKYYSEIS